MESSAFQSLERRKLKSGTFAGRFSFFRAYNSLESIMRFIWIRGVAVRDLSVIPIYERNALTLFKTSVKDTSLPKRLILLL